jgi:hypothetical protein
VEKREIEVNSEAQNKYGLVTYLLFLKGANSLSLFFRAGQEKVVKKLLWELNSEKEAAIKNRKAKVLHANESAWKLGGNWLCQAYST